MVQIREARMEDAQAIAVVHVNSWKETYAGIISQAYLSQLSYMERTALWKKIIASGAKVFVAENQDGEIVGFGNGGKERSGAYPSYQGEVYALYLLKAYQRQGIGKEIVKRIVAYLHTQHLQGMLIWVLADNPSVGFYKIIGGKKLDEEVVHIGGTDLMEVAYGWGQMELIKQL